MNKQWHATHKMATNATITQRIDWHNAHAQHCGCRPIPESVLGEMKARGIVPFQ